MSRRSIKTTAPGGGAATAQKIPAWHGLSVCLSVSVPPYQRNIEFRSKRLRATSCRCGGTKTRRAGARHFGAKRAGSPHSSSHDPHYHSELLDTIRGSSRTSRRTGSRISSCLEWQLDIVWQSVHLPGSGNIVIAVKAVEYVIKLLSANGSYMKKLYLALNKLHICGKKAQLVW